MMMLVERRYITDNSEEWLSFALRVQKHTVDTFKARAATEYMAHLMNGPPMATLPHPRKIENELGNLEN